MTVKSVTLKPIQLAKTSTNVKNNLIRVTLTQLVSTLLEVITVSASKGTLVLVENVKTLTSALIQVSIDAEIMLSALIQ